ncbi:MAG: DNA adenine methylase, partial [Syntrophothermus sp.]
MLNREPRLECSLLPGKPTPFLKWAGGKSRLIPQLSAFLPSQPFDGYLEPFVGGGAVFFHVRATLGAGRYTLIDNNAELIHAYRMVRDETDALIHHLEQHRWLHSKGHYYEVREQEPALLEPVERAARFIYLNKTCYNGLYRVNSRGQFNVPIGAYQNPQIYDSDN